MKKKYYIAYGSNLNVAQMAHRCPGATVAGVGTLQGWQLNFRGSKTGAYLTIEPKPGSSVPVGVWEITKGDEKALDRYEGFPNFYYKKEMQLAMQDILTGKESEITALVYIMNEGRPAGAPTWGYVATCFEGCTDFFIGTEALEEAVNRARKAVG